MNSIQLPLKYMKNYLLSLLLLTFFSSCAPGPCYQAMKYRKAAETVRGTEKAALLGKADAVQKECDAYNATLQEAQKLDARGKARR
jgi:hypothetical protein